MIQVIRGELNEAGRWNVLDYKALMTCPKCGMTADVTEHISDEGVVVHDWVCGGTCVVMTDARLEGFDRGLIVPPPIVPPPPPPPETGSGEEEEHKGQPLS